MKKHIPKDTPGQVIYKLIVYAFAIYGLIKAVQNLL